MEIVILTLTHTVLTNEIFTTMRNILGRTYTTTVNDRNISRNGKYSLSYLQMTVKWVAFRSYLIPLNVAAGTRVIANPANQARKINLRTVETFKVRGTLLNDKYFSIPITTKLLIVIIGNTMLM